MSYNFTVEVDTEGNARVKEGQEEGKVHNVPAGSFMISGHTQTDGKNESVGVVRKDANGSTVASSQAWHA